MHPSPPAESSLPLVIQVGFAGSRNLLPPTAKLPPTQTNAFHEAVSAHLAARLSSLHAELGLSPCHFLCGISQIAIGGDTCFTRACAAVPIPQRIFLPQTRDEFLTATGSDGSPDFPGDTAAEALALLASPHIIQERLVSHSPDRTERFEDANLEILRASDVIICLLRADADDKPGGTMELLRHALALGKPALEIRVALDGHSPSITHHWRHPEKPWTPPRLLPGLADAPTPPPSPRHGIPVSARDYLAILKNHGSANADNKQRGFRATAVKVLTAHLLATLCAVLALTLPGGSPFIYLFLAVELILLALGCWVHLGLHHSRTPQAWATHRLTAEIARSVGAMTNLHIHLDYLFELPLPRAIRPLLRTIHVLHLASSRNIRLPWREKLKNYLASRLDGDNGQINYYAAKLAEAETKRKFATIAFFTATGCAFLATSTKLCLAIAHHGHHSHGSHTLPGILGALAILLPVIAVASLSLAAAFDLEARALTYHDTLEQLRHLRPLFDKVPSERAFLQLVAETESCLLGEITNWASRRSFTSIT